MNQNLSDIKPNNWKKKNDNKTLMKAMQISYKTSSVFEKIIIWNFYDTSLAFDTTKLTNTTGYCKQNGSYYLFSPH